MPLGARVAKVVIGALGLVVTLSTLGYPVGSLLAGLGIGGLALAAQKTVENLLGAFSIGIDQPFREGDFVKVDDFVGTVEAIGLRSTRSRSEGASHSRARHEQQFPSIRPQPEFQKGAG